jgi:single-stranded DNA-binding protein
MICNQSLSVYMGKNQADLFNFYAINTANDKLNNAEIIANFTRKGVGITVAGRLVTDAWTDKQSNERKINTKIQVNQITLAPKADTTKNTESQTKPVQTNTPVAPSSSDASLWGAANAPQPTDPWTHASGGGLPDLPGQYSNSPSFDEVPF